MIKEDSLNFLVVEGYAKSSRDDLLSGGMKVASDLYKRMLLSIVPNATIDVATPADTDITLPTGAQLQKYDGVTITGSNLSVLDADNPSVKAQIEFQKEVFKLGVPSFGSCWAMQVGTVAAGGKVAVNPKGREMGFARKVRLTEDGLRHPMYFGKGPVFDCFASHEDEIVVPPLNSKVLSGNEISAVQAMEINCDKGTMWAVQYHPEYDVKDMADLIRCRAERLIELEFFTDATNVREFTDRLDNLHRNPKSRVDAWNLGIDSDILDPELRHREVRNWIEYFVLPHKHR